MLHVIKDAFPNPDEGRINTALMNREYEEPLEEFVRGCFDSIEKVLPNIHMERYTFEDDSSKVDLSEYVQVRKSVFDKSIKKITPIKKSNLGELTMYFLVTLPNDIREEISKDEKLLNSRKYKPFIRDDYNLEFSVRILIPIADDSGRYLLNGVKSYRLYQLTEKSTYITPGTDVMKSVMPVMVRRGKYVTISLTGTEYTLNQFLVLLFKGFMNAFIFYFATMGFYETLEFFRIREYIEIEPWNSDKTYDPRYEYFKIATDGCLKVNKKVLVHKYIQGMVGTIIGSIGRNEYTLEKILNKETWVKRVGITSKKVNDEVMIDLGKRYLMLFYRMYDINIKKALQLQEVNKKHIYAIIRWIIQHYDEIRMKDNLDYKNKRLRGYEQYSALLNEVISTKIKTLISHENKRAEDVVENYRRFFTFDGRALISKMHASKLTRTDDSVNDMDMFNKLKYTKKGANSLGNKNAKNISSIYRALHPSEIGIDSIYTCSASEPGLTNYINPLCSTNGLFFEGDNPEPENFYYDFINEVLTIMGEEPLNKNPEYAIVDASEFCNLFELDDGDWLT